MALKSLTQKFRDFGWTVSDSFADNTTRRQIIKAGSVVIGTLAILMLLLMFWWNMAPATFEPVEHARQTAKLEQQAMVTGYTSTETAIELAQTLLDKPGGYLSNDVMPPSVWMDNIPNWEFGVLVQIRDFTRAMRNDISRSQSQSLEDPDLAD